MVAPNGCLVIWNQIVTQTLMNTDYYSHIELDENPHDQHFQKKCSLMNICQGSNHMQHRASRLMVMGK
jgi:hypothetical protein